MIYLSRVTEADLLMALDWRESCISSLRTSDFILDCEQSEFYRSLPKRKDIKMYSIINRDPNCTETVGICGFVNFDPINRSAEISLLIDPEYKGLGIGKDSLGLLLEKGFNDFGLVSIYGECYYCNPNYGFWAKLIKDHGLYETRLPKRKFYSGEFHDTTYFSFESNPL